jgi:hypothetical protein
MRTDELINTLVADHAVQPRLKPIAHGLAMAIVGGLAISLALFLLTLGVRPDIVSALSTWRFDLKWFWRSLRLGPLYAYQARPQRHYPRCEHCSCPHSCS